MGNKQTGMVPTHSILINLCPPSHHTLSTIICIIHTLVVLGYITTLSFIHCVHIYEFSIQIKFVSPSPLCQDVMLLLLSKSD